MDIAIVVIFSGLCLWMVGYTVWSLGGAPLDVVRTYGVHDGASDAELFKKVVRRATLKLIVHDDGDKGGVYDDDAAIEALIDQMRRHKELVVHFHFNEHRDLKMVAQLQWEFGASRFDVRHRPSEWRERKPDEVHYAIADDEFGLLSRRDRRAAQREWLLVDCECVKRSERIRQFAKHQLRFMLHYHLSARPLRLKAA